MATEKKTEQVATVEERLRSLYRLQTILSHIDRIKTVRGELPLEVNDLKDRIEGLNVRIANYTDAISHDKQALAAEKEKINECRSKIERYKEQLNDVKNNREYDLLSKEIEFQTLEIELCEKHIHLFEREIETKTAEIEATKTQLADTKHVLSEKESELDEIVSETRKEEEDLREEALKIEATFPENDRTLKAFKRIRKNARNGLGVVYVQRNACGGCFNRIPPQKQMEIKMHKKIIVCEYCGRIMIDPELAGVETPEAE